MVDERSATLIAVNFDAPQRTRGSRGLWSSGSVSERPNTASATGRGAPTGLLVPGRILDKRTLPDTGLRALVEGPGHRLAVEALPDGRMTRGHIWFHRPIIILPFPPAAPARPPDLKLPSALHPTDPRLMLPNSPVPREPGSRPPRCPFRRRPRFPPSRRQRLERPRLR